MTSVAQRDVCPANRPADLMGFHCPVCGQSSVAPLHRFALTQAAEWIAPKSLDYSAHQLIRAHIARLWKQDFADVVRCLNCRFCFPIPYVAFDPEAWADLLRPCHYPAHRWEFRETAKFLSTAAPPQKLLEVGAGVGHFVRLLRQNPKLRGCEIFATEVSPELVSKLRTLSVHAEMADLELLAARQTWRGLFDSIACFNTLHYMAPVDRVFTTFRDLLATGGFLFLSTRAGDRVDFNEQRLRQWEMPPLIVGRWYEGTFHAVASRHGFRLALIRLAPYQPSRIILGAAREYLEVLTRQDNERLLKVVGSLSWRPLRVFLKLSVGAVRLLPTMPLIARLRAGYSQLIVLQKI